MRYSTFFAPVLLAVSLSTMTASQAAVGATSDRNQSVEVGLNRLLDGHDGGVLVSTAHGNG
jgi:hypothetical protein